MSYAEMPDIEVVRGIIILFVMCLGFVVYSIYRRNREAKNGKKTN